MKSFVFRLQFRRFVSQALVRRQAIIWTNADPIACRIYAALGGDKF